MKSLGLYKQLVRYGQNLKYTDKDFYFRKIRTEFEKNRQLTNPAEVKYKTDQGIAFLKKEALL